MANDPTNNQQAPMNAQTSAPNGNARPQARPGVARQTAPNGAGIAGGTARPGAVAKTHAGRTIAIVVVAVVAVTAIIVAIVMNVLSNQSNFYDSNSLIGQAPYKSEEEIQAELDRIVEEGMLNISIASLIEFPDGASEGVAYIENVPGNHYVVQVDIVLDDTGEVIYKSGGLKPDSYIEKINLARDLDAGSYTATATFHALDEDTLNEVGQAAAKITINVLE